MEAGQVGKNLGALGEAAWAVVAVNVAEVVLGDEGVPDEHRPTVALMIRAQRRGDAEITEQVFTMPWGAAAHLDGMLSAWAYRAFGGVAADGVPTPGLAKWSEQSDRAGVWWLAGMGSDE